MTPFHSIFYVSRSALPRDNLQAAVEDIVADARHRNVNTGLTGALLFTGTHFAQYLEGQKSQLDVLLSSLERDPRHEGLQVIDRSQIYRRLFQTWNMAYFGPAQFVARPIMELAEGLDVSPKPRGAQWLIELMSEFRRN